MGGKVYHSAQKVPLGQRGRHLAAGRVDGRCKQMCLVCELWTEFEGG